MKKSIGVYLVGYDPAGSCVQDVRRFLEKEGITVVGPAKFPESNDWKTVERVRCCLNSFTDITVPCLASRSDEVTHMVIGLSMGMGIPVIPYSSGSIFNALLQDVSRASTEKELLKMIKKIGQKTLPPRAIPAEEGYYTDDEVDGEFFHVEKTNDRPPPDKKRKT